jgi:hypothetical protein
VSEFFAAVNADGGCNSELDVKEAIIASSDENRKKILFLL